MTTHPIHQVWALMPHLPPYAEVEMTYFGRDMVLMARDIPREGRRFTNLTTGMEWFPEGDCPPEITRLMIREIEARP